MPRRGDRAVGEFGANQVGVWPMKGNYIFNFLNPKGELMTTTPMLDKIAAEECLDDSSYLSRALKELEAHHKAALHPNLGLDLSLRCTINGWALFYADGSSPEVMLPRGSAGYFTAEDAIQALREKVDGRIVQAEGEDADPCTEAARKAGLHLHCAIRSFSKHRPAGASH